MRRLKLVPRTLSGQLLLSVMLSLLLTMAIGVWLLLNDRNVFDSALRCQSDAERLAGIVSMLDRTQAKDRGRLIAILNEPGNFFSFNERWAADTPQSTLDQTFDETLQSALGQPRPVQVRPSELLPIGPAGPHPSNLREHERFRVIQTRLQDGTVLTWRHADPPFLRNTPARTVFLLAILALTVAVLASLLVRRLTRPLAGLADAATSLAGNFDQPPLPESGPREVARAARAFNRMQRDLKSYLASRAQMLAGVSHDLRLPITRMRLRLEQLTDPTLRAQLEADLAEMDTMIGHTLDYLRARQVKETPVRLDLDALLDCLVDDFSALGLTVSVAGTVGRPVTARPQALRRCLGNLVENARRYAGDQVDLSVADGGGLVTILIEDRGPGIPSELRDRVFEPFFRLESSRARSTGGSGLGLAIARATARAMGGELALEDRPGGGLTARLTFPG